MIERLYRNTFHIRNLSSSQHLTFMRIADIAGRHRTGNGHFKRQFLL